MRKQIILSFYLCLYSALCSISMSANPFKVGNLWFDIIPDKKNEAILVNSRSGMYSGNVIIPGNITYNNQNYQVTNIGEGAFANCRNLVEINIPKSIKAIDQLAFHCCDGLQKVDVEDLSSWCNINFGGWNSNPLRYAHNMYIKGKLIEKLIIPEGVTKISNRSFQGCSSITSVQIPNSVNHVGESAFAECQNLESLELGTGIGYVGDYAFEKCHRMKKVEIKDLMAWCNIDFGGWDSNPVSIAHNLYLNGNLITDLIIPEGVPQIKKYAFKDCFSISSVYIPSSVLEIQDYAFYNCLNLCAVETQDLEAWCNIKWGPSYSNPIQYAHNLYLNKNLITELKIPHGVTEISSNLFKGCKSLSKVNIPNSVTYIGSSAFEECTSLGSVVLSENVNYIGAYAFYNCFNLDSLCIPDKIETIDNYAFANCFNLAHISVPDKAIYLGHSIFSGTAWLDIHPNGPVYIGKVLYETKGNSIENSHIIVEDGVEVIGPGAFEGCKNLVSIDIPESVVSIRYLAFGDCENLQSINVNSLNPSYCDIDGVLYNKNSTQLVSYPGGLRGPYEIPNSVTSIFDGAFYGCNGLSSVLIPKSVSYFLLPKFEKCINLQEIKVDSLNPEFCDIDGVLFTKDKIELLSYPGGRKGNYVVPNEVKKIRSGAFRGCNGLNFVEIPEGISQISQNAFRDCINLLGVSLPNSINFISASAFENCTRLSTINIPENLKTIAPKAFKGCSCISIINLPESISSIGTYAFADCQDLESIKVDLSNQHYYDINGVLIEKENKGILCYPGGRRGSYSIPFEVSKILDGAFSGNEVLTAINIPNNVTAIGADAFRGCVAMSSVSFPDNIREIERNSFLGCEGLISLELPNSIESIESSAFENCYNLTSLRLPYKVKNIGRRAFQNCRRLNSIFISGCVSTIGWNAFSGCENLKKVEIKNLRDWCDIDFEGRESNPLTNANKLYLNGNLLTSLEIPNGISEIKKYAFTGFSYCRYVSLPKNVLKIGLRAFEDCSGLIRVYAENLKSWCNIDFQEKSNPLIWGHNLYIDSCLVEDLIIPQEIIKVKDYAFQDCSSIKSIKLNDNVQTLGKMAFVNCLNLRNLTIKHNIITNKGDAFNGCEKLNFLTLGCDVSELDDNLFYECDSLKEIYAKNAMPPFVKGRTFVNYNANVYVPKGSVRNYKVAEYWKDFRYIHEIDFDDVDDAINNRIKVFGSDGCIVIEGLNRGEQVEVYTISGQCIYSGKDSIIPVPGLDLYIVRVRRKTFKVLLYKIKPRFG